MTDYDNYQTKFNEYIELLNSSYEEAIDFLKNKYGEVTDNYYKKNSYQRFLNGEIKTIGLGKYSKTKEGLYCHHIYEDQFLNLSSYSFIREYKYDYKYQKRKI